MIKAIIFDVDGVIFNTEEQIFRLIKRLCRKYKCSIKTKKEFLDMYDENFYKSLGKKGVKGKQLDKFKQECETELKKLDVHIFNKIPLVIKELSRHYYLAVISSNFRKVISRNLKNKGLLGCFSLIVGADKIESKTEKLKKCLKEFNIKPSEAVYVGDTAGDIKEAKKIKLKSLAVTWGFHSRTVLKKANPAYIISKPKQILKILKIK